MTPDCRDRGLQASKEDRGRCTVECRIPYTFNVTLEKHRMPTHDSVKQYEAVKAGAVVSQSGAKFTVLQAYNCLIGTCLCRCPVTTAVMAYLWQTAKRLNTMQLHQLDLQVTDE